MKRVAIIITLSLLFYSCGDQIVPEKQAEIKHVRTIQVSSERMTFPVRSSGILVSASEIKLSFKTGGIIRALYANDGAKVSKGALLAVLDLSEIEAQVNQARNGYEKALRDFNRAKNLYKDSVATLEQLQNAETALNVARASLDMASFNREHSRITAPGDGIILKRLAEVHEVIGPGYPVFVFGTTGTNWKIQTGLADRNYVRISIGDSARITFDAYSGESFMAVVGRMGEAAHPMTGTYEVELDMQPVKKRLASGFIANVEIYPSQAETYFRIPVESIVEANGKEAFVFSITDSLTVVKKRIKLAGIYDSWAAVSDGISGNEILAAEGAAFLTHGDKIEIVK